MIGDRMIAVNITCGEKFCGDCKQKEQSKSNEQLFVCRLFLMNLDHVRNPIYVAEVPGSCKWVEERCADCFLAEIKHMANRRRIYQAEEEE